MNKNINNKRIIEDILKQKEEYITAEKSKVKERYINKKRERGKKVVIYLLLCLGVIINFLVKYNLFNTKYYDDKIPKEYSVMVLQNTKIGEYATYEVKLKGKNDSYSDKFLLNIYYNDKVVDTVYSYGDILVFSGKIKIPESLKNEGEFNYKNYLNAKNIVGTIATYNVFKEKNIDGNLFLKYCYQLKEYFNQKIDENIPKKEANLLKSMIYGDKKELDQNISDDFNNIGISHILSVSGANVAIVVYIVKLLLERFKIKKKYINIAITGILLIFITLANFELSILRACIMCILLIYSEQLGKKLTTLERIIISLLLVLIINSYSVLSVGMQLSYMATLSITLFYSKTYNQLKYLFKLKKTNQKKIRYIIKKEVISLLSITCSVQILLIPLQLYYFNSFNFLMFISNIVIVFIASIATNIGVIMLIFSKLDIIYNVLINFEYLLLNFIINIASFLSKIDFLSFSMASPSLLSIIIYYLLIFVIFFRKNIFSYIDRIKNLTLKRIVTIVFNNVCRYKYKYTILYITLTIVYHTFFDNYMYFFNIGQGNASLLHYRGKNIIFDCGSTQKGVADRTILSYLKYKGIKSIDAVIISHMHEDHISGIQKLLSSINVEYLIFSNSKEKNKSQDELINVALNSLVKKIEVIKGDNLQIGKYIDINILMPPSGIVRDKDVLNANSMIVKLNINNNKNVLFMGDATIATEKVLLEDLDEKMNIDILQVGHHGSKTSTSTELLDRLKVSTAVISSKKSIYGHPAQETLDKLKNKRIDIKITQYSGGIKINM